MNQYITGTAIRNQREQRKMTQLEIATNGVFEENRKAKHERDAKNGWYRYDTRFALPVYGDDGNIERYNIFRGRLLIRHASSGRKYLYDILEIKKEMIYLLFKENDVETVCLLSKLSRTT